MTNIKVKHSSEMADTVPALNELTFTRIEWMKTSRHRIKETITDYDKCRKGNG